MTVGLDFETWSDVDLPTKGLDNYIKSPNFRVLLASVYDGEEAQTFDFVWDKNAWTALAAWLEDHRSETIIAQNAGFERAVLDWLYPGFDWWRVRDSAVEARAAGVGSKLIVASRQLTNSYKLEEGMDLVMLFCVPNKTYPQGPNPTLIRYNKHLEKWTRFIEYCEMDAEGCFEIDKVCGELLGPQVLWQEELFEQLTYTMNQNGWHVDVELVEKMKQRGWVNGIIADKLFREDVDSPLNFRSPAQLKKFCADRGWAYKSLDKYHLPLELEKVTDKIERLRKIIGNDKYSDMELQLKQLTEIKIMLETKQELGGSTLSKLPRILDLVSEDNILRNQYMHVGAGQTFRTTGVGVQMQNLKKLDGNIRDMSTLFDLDVEWSNGDMAGQLRQVFNSRHPEGEIIVGDFSAVESRGLAYLAGEEWKLDAYREGKDVYKVLVTKYLGIEYEDVTPELRPRGKYSELSCGYQASGKAVQEFMFRLGFDTTVEDATQNVTDWRLANPNVVDFWYGLDHALKRSVKRNEVQSLKIAHDLEVRFTPFTLPSIQDQHPGALSLRIEVARKDNPAVVTRFVHGLYFNEDDRLLYYKPVERLQANGELWTDEYRHPKTKQMVKYSLYGGKLAGILTQSLCREMFFHSLGALDRRLEFVPNAKIVGQFHDEIAVDWWPGKYSKEHVKKLMQEAMSNTTLRDFPLTADIKSAHRYTK